MAERTHACFPQLHWTILVTEQTRYVSSWWEVLTWPVFRPDNEQKHHTKTCPHSNSRKSPPERDLISQPLFFSSLNSVGKKGIDSSLSVQAHHTFLSMHTLCTKRDWRVPIRPETVHCGGTRTHATPLISLSDNSKQCKLAILRQSETNTECVQGNRGRTK